MDTKLIFTVFFVICITSLQITYAETEFEFKFGSSGSGNDNLNNPTDVILDNNGKTIYVVDSNNNRINVFDDDGDYNFKYGTFCDITTIQDCNDNADGADDDGDGQFNGPISITRDSFGKYYVADSDNDRVQIFNDYGEFQTKFGSSDSGNDDYLGTTKGVAVQDSTRDIFVSNIDNDSISVFDSTGDFLFDFDLFDGNDDFKNPTNMVIDNSEEMLYVSDSGNDRIIVFELVDGTTCPNGTVESVDGVCFVKKFGSAGSGDGKFDDPTGLAFDSTNNLLYIADTDNNRIQVFQITEEDTCPNGTKKIVDGVCFIEEFGSTGTSDGKFDSPMGIALDTTNDLLFVADSDNDRIQAFRLDIEAQATVPNKPENPEALPVSPTSIVVLWEEPELADNVPEISGYKIEYKISGENFAVIQEDTKNILTSFIHQGLDSKETYFYRIYAINSEGTSSVSSLTSTKPGHSITPVGLTATAISPNQVRLSWLPPSETFGQSISNYEIKQELGPGVYDKIGTTNGGTTAFIISDLDTDNEYTYAVSATIGFGSTGESNSASVTPRENSEYTDYSTSTSTQATVSTPPIKLTASSVSSTQNNLSWSPPSDDGDSPIKGYKVEAKEESSSFITLVEDTKSTSRSYSHKNIDADTKYTYRVSAINSVGVSEPSNQVSVSPTTTTPQISPIGKLTIDEGKLLSFTVKLSDSSIKDVSFSLKNNPPSGAKIISSSGLFSWTPSDSDGGNTYNFDVVVKEGSTTIDRETITIVVNDVKNTEPEDTEPKDTEPKDTEPKDTEPEELGIAPFVDESKDPQSYVDRYNNEASYKKWFDDNFPEYASIYEAVGIEEPLVIPAPFVDESKDPQSYVDRYNNEASYKKWFDDNFPEYASIYEAVGIEEPLVIPAPFVDPNIDPQYYIDRYNNEITYKNWFDKTYPEITIYDAVGIDEPEITEPEFGKCGSGTELINGICTVIPSESKGGGCLIATAAYGSEMAPQVQFLREIRDNQLMITESGMSFMTGFNQLYYSFSPYIADMQRENLIFKEVVKIGITPLLASLSIMEHAESESQVLGYGIGVILMNIGMYFAAPILLFYGIKKVRRVRF